MKELRLSEEEQKIITAYRQTDDTGKACVLKLLGLEKESIARYYGKNCIPFQARRKK